jgi:hypothetical protein
MIDRTIPRLRAALPSCVAGLRAACSRQAADREATRGAGGVAGTTTGARSGGAAAAQAGGAGAALADDGAPAQGQTDANDGGNDGDDGDSDGSDWPDVRDVPGGTLAWTVVYTGTGTTRNSEASEVTVLHRKLEGTAHMSGAMGNAGDTPHPKPLEDINKAMEACGDDMACQRKTVMAMAGKDPAALERSVRNAMTEAQRDTLWAADDCDITGEANDTSTWSGMTSDGFNTGHGVRAGKQAVEGCGEGDVPRLVADDNTHTYKLVIPQARIRVPALFEGTRKDSGRLVMFPALEIKGVRYARLDRPLKGSASLRTGSGIGLYSEGWSMPLAEEVSWTFTPDAR